VGHKKTPSAELWFLDRGSTYYMYAFTPGQMLCLVYEDFYLAIYYIFFSSSGRIKSGL